ncbi:hypothetical protein CBM2634_B60046 [Cupriavidus taiwanensis]|uniref:Uncharacterized protein n=1 Tax=Cupriavidus taiwanensis TaxID=164546 RepID=A0A375JBX8_9BURK|nr:hypothetical protein CBM2634_B60046 [Cupriavidus taiwanensis]
MSMARNGLGDYSDNVSELLNDLIKKGDEHARVVCFASAAEFGVPMRHQSERCRLAAASWFITRQHLAPRPSHSLHDLCERPDQ